MTTTLGRLAPVTEVPVSAPEPPRRPPSPADVDGLRRRELTAFLRSRRERITPEQVGLPPGGRRRTPGLRREEVAQLAGVGITWYTWLEQGRDIRVSEQVLDAIARTLLLDPHERSHLYTLAGSPAPAAVQRECESLPPAMRELLDKLHPFPACVTNGRYDLLDYNRSFTVIAGDLDALPFEERNSMWLCFTHPTRRAVLLDRPEAMRRMVGQYRAAMAEHVGDPTWKCLVKRLQHTSPEFAELWARHDVLEPENLTKRFLHPELGLLQFTYTNLWLSQRMGVRLVTYTPTDERTRHAVERFDDVAPYPLVQPVAPALSAPGA
jgi:transcriptional regulator with XRE-family HTH domain